ncbi:transporter substrate-binding domain-containing protein [Pseudomonas fluorescens]|uniref:Virulence sensor protein BvgS n=1 Tax=Pseudomonas fluorescens TaxID=294 RepID=A0A5E7B376_PSEFL|nr:transporter substrate-binding domain-containing protein [Pseudomonas fluorescens]VVN85395.1 Virulence sensor protein BvgS [Pseudomonas fluorescens]
MQFFIRFKPGLCRWLFFAAMAFGHPALAVHGGSFAPETSIADKRPRLDAAELEWIREHPQVIVASLQYPLYLFKDKRGQWAGWNSDILKRISSLTGLQFIHEETFSNAQMLELLESGKADMSTTLAVNDERKAFLSFSHAFGGSGWVFVIRADDSPWISLEQLAGRVLALPERHALEAGIKADYPDIRLRLVKTYAEARALVESGEADVTIENETGAQLYPRGQLKVGSRVEGKWASDHLAIRKSQPQLLSILNKALDAFTAAELQAIRQKWVGSITPAAPASLWQRVSRWVCWGAVIAMVSGLISLVWNRRLKLQVQQRLKVERQLKDQLAFEQVLLNAFPDPVFVRDLQARLVMCNKSYEERLSVRQDQIQGRRLTEVDVFPRETAEQLHGELMEQLKTQKTRFVNRQLRLKTGVMNVYQWTVPFYSAEGQLRGLLGGWIDFNERKESDAD